MTNLLSTRQNALQAISQRGQTTKTRSEWLWRKIITMAKKQLAVRIFFSTLMPSMIAPASASAADFQARCSQPGVIKCVGFDSSTDISGVHGDRSGTLSGSTAPTLDATVKASGNNSLKFTIPAGSPGGVAGAYFTNFSDDLLTQFGEGGEFYVQWRQRFSPEFVNPGAGWKQSIIGEGDNPGCSRSNSLTKQSGGFCASSCTQLEVVTQNSYNIDIPQMYHSCGVKDGQYQPLSITAGSQIHVQYSADVPNCLYPGPYTEPRCVVYKQNQWMTFQVHVKIGTWYKNTAVYRRDSTVQLWVADEGQPSKLVFDRSPASGTGYDLVNLTPSISNYGKVFLLPYSGTDPFPQGGQTWYDELIISRNRIPDPGSTSTSQPPVAPTSLILQ